MEDNSVAAEMRELMLYLRPSDGEVSGAELKRRRNELRKRNPRRAQEYRSAAFSVEHWREEMRNQHSATMTVAEMEARVAALEGLLA